MREERHVGLIVEDDNASAEDLAEILASVNCDSVVADNKAEAIVLLRERLFCFVLLDLEIKGTPDAIKAHTAHGHALLREIRRLNPEHTGSSYWLPILVISGFAREVAAAVDVMKDGAGDVVQKPFNSRDVSDAVRRALEISGRVSHGLCGGPPRLTRPSASEVIVLAIPGDRERRRTRVTVGSRRIMLTDACLKTLLRLMVAHEQGAAVHKTSLGAKDYQGFKGISVLREALRPVLPAEVDIIANDYHGSYRLADSVLISDCNATKLEQVGDPMIAKLGRDLQALLDARPAKV